MDMSLEDTLAALGLEDEATVFPRTCGDRGGNSFVIPIGWSGNYRGDFTLTPGRLLLPLAPPGVTWTLSAGRGALLVLQVGGLGLRAVILAPRLCGLRGLRGHLQMFGASAARHMAHPPLRACIPCPSLSSRPLYESSRLADPYQYSSQWGGGCC